MFVQNCIQPSAAVHELSWQQRKNSDKINTVRRYRAVSKTMSQSSTAGNGSISVVVVVKCILHSYERCAAISNQRVCQVHCRCTACANKTVP